MLNRAGGTGRVRGATDPELTEVLHHPTPCIERSGLSKKVPHDMVPWNSRLAGQQFSNNEYSTWLYVIDGSNSWLYGPRQIKA